MEVSGRFDLRRGLLCAAASLAVIIAADGAARPAHAQPSPPSRRSSAVLELRNLMTPVEFRTAGLERLTAQELASLDGWIGRLVVRLLTERKQAGCASAVETRIDGDFEGWNGDTLFELENGQVWKQRGSASQYTYRFSPAVVIYRSESGCKMKVDGVEGEILVERLK
jgi:hypothetical protein